MQKSDAPRIGFIGFGEAAFEICKGLREEGVAGLTAYDKYWNTPPRDAIIKNRASEAGVTLLSSLGDVVANNDIIFCAVSAAAAIPIAQEVAVFLKPEKIYVDINSASPNTKKEVEKIIESSGAQFVDIAVMGTVPEGKHKVPMLACGSGAKKITTIMNAYGMNIKYVGEEAGMASAIKMVRSIFMKGYAALWIECLIAASAYNCEALVLESVRESIEGKNLQTYLPSFLMRTGIHAERRASEMKEVLSMLGEIESPSVISQATLWHLERIARLSLTEKWSQKTPSGIEEIISTFKKGY